MKKFFNPKRVKIIIGIIVILSFGIILDFIRPIPKEHDYFDYDYYDKQLTILSSAIDKYFLEKGEFPEILIGGDEDGHIISAHYQKDDLISKKILNAYPERKIDSNFQKRLKILFEIKNPLIGLSGKSGNLMMNVKYANISQAREFAEKYQGLNPLVGNFYYDFLKPDKSSIIIGILEPHFYLSFNHECKYTGGFCEIHSIDSEGKVHIVKGNKHDT